MSAPTPIHYQNGQSESLDFAPLSNTETLKFLNLMIDGDESQIVMLCARRNLAWVESLEFDCLLALNLKFVNENFSRAMKIVNGSPVAFLKFGPMFQRLAIALKFLPSNNSAPTPAPASAVLSASPSAPVPAASAPAIGSAATPSLPPASNPS